MRNLSQTDFIFIFLFKSYVSAVVRFLIFCSLKKLNKTQLYQDCKLRYLVCSAWENCWIFVCPCWVWKISYAWFGLAVASSTWFGLVPTPRGTVRSTSSPVPGSCTWGHVKSSRSCTGKNLVIILWCYMNPGTVLPHQQDRHDATEWAADAMVGLGLYRRSSGTWPGPRIVAYSRQDFLDRQ